MERYKFWSCCQRRTSDFNEFQRQEGCTSGSHAWVKVRNANVPGCVAIIFAGGAGHEECTDVSHGLAPDWLRGCGVVLCQNVSTGYVFDRSQSDQCTYADKDVAILAQHSIVVSFDSFAERL